MPEKALGIRFVKRIDSLAGWPSTYSIGCQPLNTLLVYGIDDIA